MPDTVTFDTAAISQGYAGGDRTVSITPGAQSNRLVVATVAHGGTVATGATAPLWNCSDTTGTGGSTMAEIYNATNGSTSLRIHYKLNPDTTASIVWTKQLSGPTFLYVTSWYNVNQSTPFATAGDVIYTALGQNYMMNPTADATATDGIYLGVGVVEQSNDGSFNGTSSGNMTVLGDWWQTSSDEGSANFIAAYQYPGATQGSLYTRSAWQEKILYAMAIINSAGVIYEQATAGSITKTGALTKIPAKVLAGAITKTGEIDRLTLKAVVGAITNTGAVNKLIDLASGFVGDITNAGALARTTLKTLAGTVTFAEGTITRKILKVLAGAVTFAGGAAGSLATMVRKVITFWLDDQIATDAHIDVQPENEDE